MQSKHYLHYWAIVYVLVLTCSAFGRGFPWNRYDDKSPDWFSSDQARQVADNVIAAQDEYGAWPKNIDTSSPIPADNQEDLRGTFDNGATVGEMRFLANMFNATKDAKYKDVFIKAFDLIISSQYPTGGWPQRFPPGKYYHRHITFNDGAMVRLMELLDEIVTSSDYSFIGQERIKSAEAAFDRGIECILKCQIKVNGKLTVWCAQHDEIDYSPRPARSYELVSLSGGESAGILHLLMSIEPPTPQIVKAVTSAVEWYKTSSINDYVFKRVNGKFMLEKSPGAKSIWARFYEIETNRPIFCDRDGIKKYNYSEIDQERSTSYAWYGSWGEEVFSDYAKWSDRWSYMLLPEGTKIMAIIGDSTVCDYPLDQVRRGWGQFIQECFNDKIKVYNFAKSGRSTKTFIEQKLWENTLEVKPAYILIQFGHNDSHTPGRKEATYADSQSPNYKEYLLQYIRESRAIGAEPILVTPMYRRKFDEAGNIHDNLLPYANAMKAVAEEMDVPLVDLNSASEQLYLKLGTEKILEFANAPDDQTHFNEKGARAMAELVMEQLPEVEPTLKQYLD